MRKNHPKNVRIKHKYFAHLEEVNRMKATTVNQVAAALTLYEDCTGFKDFKLFHTADARKFKRMLAGMKSATTGRLLSKSTIYHRLMALKAFFIWLSDEKGYFPKIRKSNADYFNPSNHDTEIAKRVREKRIPSLDEVLQALRRMPVTTDMQKRDRGIFAFIFMTAVRVDAAASLLIGDIDMARCCVYQDGAHVRTKFRKTIHTNFGPVADEIEAAFTSYYEHLTCVLGFGPSDPLFPATLVGVGKSRYFEALGLDHVGWKSGGKIREIFKDAFAAAGIRYYNPHTARDFLVAQAIALNPNAEEEKALSLSLGHDKVATTLRNYYNISQTRQTEVMDRLRAKARKQPGGDGGEYDAETVKGVLAQLARTTG